MRILDIAVGAAALVSGIGILVTLWITHATGLYAISTAYIGVVGTVSGAWILRRVL